MPTGIEEAAAIAALANTAGQAITRATGPPNNAPFATSLSQVSVSNTLHEAAARTGAFLTFDWGKAFGR